MTDHSIVEGMDEKDSNELISILRQAIKCKDLFSKPKLRYPMVPASQWVNDEYYVGVEGSYIYPYWKNLLIDIFETNRGKYNEVILSGGLGCLKEDTKIPTSLGLLTLKQIAELPSVKLSDKVKVTLPRLQVYTEGGFKDINLVKDRGVAQTKRVIFESGRVIEGTPEHRFRIFDRKFNIVWRTLGSLKPSDYLICHREERPFGKMEMTKDTLDSLALYSKSKQEVAPSIYLLNRNGIAYVLKNLIVDYKVNSNSRNYLKDIQSLLDLFGINSKIENQTLSVETDGYNIVLFHKKILQDEKFNQTVENQVKELAHKHIIEDFGVNTTTAYLIKKYDIYVDKVKSIYTQKSYCRDLNISACHNYSVGPFISHNTGKTSCANFLMVRKLYELSCYEHIAGLFDLMPSSIIGFMYFNVSKAQAELTGYGQFKGMIDQIPYFRDRFPRNDRLDSILQFPDNVMFMYGSSSVHCLVPNSMIMTSKGIVRAKQLTDRYFVYNGSEFKKVRYTYKATGEMYKVYTDTGRELITKDNHLHYTHRGFVETQHLEYGDLLFTGVNGYENTTTKSFKSIHKIENFNPKLLTLIGIIIGTGEIVYKNNIVVIDRFLTKNIDYIKEVLPENTKIQDRAVAYSKITIQDLKLVNLLKKLEVSEERKDRVIPDSIVNLKLDEQFYFFYGLFLSSGKLDKRTFSFTFSSPSLGQDLHNLLSCLGFQTTYHEKNLSKYPVYIVFLKNMSNERFCKLLPSEDRELRGAFLCKTKDSQPRGMKDSLQIESVVKIEYLGEQECYGASVEGELYTCNSLITHNSIGMNIIGTILDEANFFQKDAQSTQKSTMNYSKVADMYSSVVNRSASRFMSKGHDSSLSILVSSNTSTSSFTDKRIRESLLQGKDSKTKVVNARLWEVKPKGTYSDKCFYVFKGSNLIDPFIIKEVNDIRQYLESVNKTLTVKTDDIDEAIKSLDAYDREQFIAIPEDFRKSFEINVTRSLQDIAGISVAPMGKLFNSRTTYLDSCTDNIIHPFYKDEISVATGDSIQVWDFLRKGYRPRNIDKPRYMHIDMSTTNDSTGIGMCYIDHWESTPSGVQLPYIIIDMKLKIKPPHAPRKISIQKIIDFIFYMREKWRIEYGYISQDQFQSSYSLQAFAEAGIPSGLESVDRTADAYLYYIQCMYEGRIKGYRYAPEEKELFDLLYFPDAGQNHGGKVDHPSDGCLLGNTLIKTTKGNVPIYVLMNKKATLYSSTETGAIVESPMKKCWISKFVDSLYKITFSDGSVVKGTDNHLFRLSNLKYIRADKLSAGMSMLTDNPEPIIVTDIEKISFNGVKMPVYDIEMEKTDNFQLYNSIIVHNSKDVCDGIVGAVYNAFKHGSAASPGITQSSVGGMLDFYKDMNIDEDEGFTMQELLDIPNISAIKGD